MRPISLNQNDPHRYDDILNLPHHVSKKHPQMARLARAAQFAPFSALTGYEEAINETGRQVDEKHLPGADEQEEINAVLQEIVQLDHPYVSVCYFVADEKKDGGHYEEKEGAVRRIDNGMIEFSDRSKIAIRDIRTISLL
ncbi:MAG: hypothetical protein SOI44_08540 [Lactimicrobium sp.]|jgi:hypothetical protein|uniref:hypothetical protein n=1 Tax=Lactimicrobium sp. TaxID=2563780 RepID=UPI002F3539B0